MKRVLFVDDSRERFDILSEMGVIPPHTVWANDFNTASDEIKKQPWDIVFLDHDLECFEFTPYKHELTGQDVANVLVEQAWRPECVIIHTVNPAGSEAIWNVLADHNFPHIKKIPFNLLSMKLAKP